MARLIQVGVGSGGMPVLDIVARDPRITHVTIIEPDLFKPHNVERHLFPIGAVGEEKADVAKQWLLERRPDLAVEVLKCELQSDTDQARIEQAVRSCDLGICAVDNEPAKYHWDRLMRRHGKPWTLGEVLSGGIGGFVHWFVPGGACYGCVASFLKRSVTVDKPKAPDYSQPGGAIEETTVPASLASIRVIASLHARLTLDLLASLESKEAFDPGFTSLLLTLQAVPDVFDQPYRPHKFRVPRNEACLICQEAGRLDSGEDLSEALEQALSRLSDD